MPAIPSTRSSASLATELSRRASHLNSLFASTAREIPGIEFMNVGLLISGPDGGYTSFLGDSRGRLVRVRMEDGIHYSSAGAQILSRWVVDWIRQGLARTESAQAERR